MIILSGILAMIIGISIIPLGVYIIKNKIWQNFHKFLPLAQAAYLSAISNPESWELKQGFKDVWVNHNFSVISKNYSEPYNINSYKITKYEYDRIAAVLNRYKNTQTLIEREKLSKKLMGLTFEEAKLKLLKAGSIIVGAK